MTPDEAQERIACDLLEAGLPPGKPVLVHSSLSALGAVPGGAETVVRGLLDALGPSGTLLMPALSYSFVDAAHPVFDVWHTRSCVGAIPEHFRKRVGTLRSVSPTHSVCGVGADAEALLKEHIFDDTPAGAHSPFRLLHECDGLVLFLGCGLKPNTSMHGVEELVNPPYLFGASFTYTVVLANGQEIQLPCRRHNFAGVAQRYDRIEGLLQGGGLKVGKVLEATTHILQCRPMWEQAHEALKKDPLYFVEKIAS